jgi:predicted lipoprotein with Yx(FWY)xxD motif
VQARSRTSMMVALALLTTACGGDDLDAAEGSADDAGAAAVAEADLAVAASGFGDILVDGDGMTLYLFTNDRDGQSVCEDDCAAAWPPLVVDGEPVAGEGVDASLLGTTERDDGDTQVTYAGWPLYTWAQDQEPGDVTGQGVNDVWFVVAPDGEAITGSDDGEDREASRTDGY